MQQLTTGIFYGQTNKKLELPGLTITETEYTHDKVDWHYHEHAYFTFLIAGKVIEVNKKETFQCNPGTLLFHNSQDPHYNIKPAGYTRGFHVEVNNRWFKEFDLKNKFMNGSADLRDPLLKISMYNLFKETKIDDPSRDVAIQSLLLAIFTSLGGERETSYKVPAWVAKIKELLNDEPFEREHSLLSIATALNIHPVHLSRDFSRYFNCNLGEYMRTIKLQRALSLMNNRNISLTDIALQSGFSDQSHFSRLFKAEYLVTPFYYRKLLQE